MITGLLLAPFVVVAIELVMVVVAREVSSLGLVELAPEEVAMGSELLGSVDVVGRSLCGEMLLGPLVRPLLRRLLAADEPAESVAEESAGLVVDAVVVVDPAVTV